MNIKTKLFGSLLLVATITMTPVIVRSKELSIPHDNNVYQLTEQIHDLELMGCDITKCYEAEKRTIMLASLSRHSFADLTQLNSELIDRVFGHLAGTSEYRRFVKAYWALILIPDYKQLYSTNLYAEYQRLISSARARLTTQLKDRLISLSKKRAAQFHVKSGLSESGFIYIVVRQNLEDEKPAQSKTVSTTIIEKSQALLTALKKRKDLAN
ncbi:MAG: hypothetical protein ACP5VS_08335 [Desulfomonilaceae bacterium]